MHAKDVINATCEKSISDKNGYDIDSTYLKKTGDVQNNTVTFETDDNVETTVQFDPGSSPETIVGYETEDKKWHIMHPLDIKDKLSESIGKITTLFHNVRFLYELCGKNDISKISDGTLTGAINSLNTGISTLSNRYINTSVGANSHRKLTFVGFFCAIISFIGQDSGSQGTFIAQGYGNYYPNAERIKVATIQAGDSISCTPVEGEQAVQIKNATANGHLAILMLEGALPQVTL